MRVQLLASAVLVASAHPWAADRSPDAPSRRGSATAAAATATAAAAAPSPRPNIVLFLSDDQDAAATGYDAAAGIHHMPLTNAALRAPGALFTHHLLATPLCAPSRAVLLTGAYPHNTGVFLNDKSHGAYAYWERVENR